MEDYDLDINIVESCYHRYFEKEEFYTQLEEIIKCRSHNQ